MNILGMKNCICQELQKETQTYASIANLNFARDTKNKNAKEENEFYDKITPEIAAIDNRFTKVLYICFFF